MDDVAIVERQLGREPRAFRRVAVRCPFGRPAVSEQRPFDDDGGAVSDAVLAHLPASRDADLAARGRGRGRALDAGGRGGRRATRESRARRTPSSARSDRSCRSASRARAAPAASSACTRTPRSRSRGRATSSARASSPRPRRSGRRTAAARLYDRPRRGRRTRPPAMGRRAPAVRALSGRSRPRRGSLALEVELIVAELRRRIGHTFTLEELAAALRRRGRVGARGALRRTAGGRAAARHEPPSPTRPSSAMPAARSDYRP